MKYFSSAFLACAIAAFASCGTETDDTWMGSFPVGASAADEVAGSYTRVLAVGDFLYAVDTRSVITYDLSDRDNPVEVDRTDVGLAVETIFHLDGNLFIGSSRGMFTYSIADDGHPVRRGRFDYSLVTGGVEPCDPVVANSRTAFATLYAEDAGVQTCGGDRGDVEMLVVMDITNLDRPTLVNTYNTPTPRGLALDGDFLFVCNDASGLTVFDVSDPARVTMVDRVVGVMAWDVIAKDGVLIVVGTEEVVQYDYADPTDLVELSRLPYSRT